MRKRLPDTRRGVIKKVKLFTEQGDIDLFININRYEDGDCAEVFVSLGKQGSTLQGMVDAWAMMVSIALQHGTPLDKVVEKFTGHAFPPAGMTSDPEFKNCSSILDLVVRVLARESNVPV